MSAKGRIKRLRVRLRRFHRKQQAPVAIPPTDHSSHTCVHCGHEYEGRLCPQCGMSADWHRFTWKGLVRGFLDIWGMGNRPMFRSMEHLLWRPGYMIRDYLNGHQLSYFPPFKMLAVLTVLVAFAVWALGLQPEVAEAVASSAAENSRTSIIDDFPGAIQFIKNTWHFIYDNPLYFLLFQLLFFVVATWIVFRRKGLNLVETFFAMVYISCQMQLVTLVWILLTRDIQVHSIFPYALPELLVTLILVLDFRQLYGIRFWPAVWRTTLICLTYLVIITVAIIVALLLFVCGLYVVKGIT